MKAKLSTESRLKMIEQRYLKIINDNIPRVVQLGFNSANRELYIEFLKPYEDKETGELNLTDFDPTGLAEKIRAEYLKTKVQYDEAEKDIIDNTFIPPENIELAKQVMGDKFYDFFKEIEPEDKNETTKTE